MKRSLCFSLVVFLGAFLLFQIEPLIGKIVTLNYGGTASVWTICILFFQFVVLAGYFVTFLVSKLPARTQILTYTALFLVSLYWSIIPAGTSWECRNVEEPVSGLLLALAYHLAVPCILLSTISGMMQFWFALQRLGNPYPLYSVSNIGSIGALLAYPILIEPNLTISNTLLAWSGIYWLLAVLIVTTATFTWRKVDSNYVPLPQPEPGQSQSVTITPWRFFWWTALSFMGSITLLSYTSYITGDIAPMPLIWVLPLSIYLLTFVLVFSHNHFYWRKPYLLAWAVLLIIEAILQNQLLIPGVIVNLLLVFTTCMICHGELAHDKPPAVQLPSFYLAMALGGALGGIFVGILAPMLFTFEAEKYIAVYVMALSFLYVFALKAFIQSKKWPMVVLTLLIVVVGTIADCILLTPKKLLHMERNFYSSVRVLEEKDLLVFCNGRTNHGQQFLDPAKADIPASPYWLPVTPIVDYMKSRYDRPIKYGSIGLGVGILAIYGRPGDEVTYYELDPKVERIARKYFTYLSRSKAQTDILIGDGRAVLSRRPPQHYDFLLIDAFNGDAIPCHLLTKEALESYLEHLNQNGLLVFHVSNNFVDLPPILGNLAKVLHLRSCTIQISGAFTTVVMSREPMEIEQLIQFTRAHQDKYEHMVVVETPTRDKLKIWTDDYTNLASVLKIH